MTALLVFVCGAFYEASCVGFVHFSGRSAWKTAVMSALAGLAEVTGIFGTVHDWHVGPFFVVGLGIGAYLGVRLNLRRATTSPPEGSLFPPGGLPGSTSVRAGLVDKSPSPVRREPGDQSALEPR